MRSQASLEILAESLRRKLTDENVDYDDLNEAMAELSKLLVEWMVDGGMQLNTAKTVMKAMIMQTGLYYEVRREIERKEGGY